MTTCPVCGKDLDEATAPAQAEYEGQTHFFCCERWCKAAFDKEPEKYVTGAEPAVTGEHSQ